MPKLIRPRHEFPTPLFRLATGLFAALVGGLPGIFIFTGAILAVHLLAIVFVGAYAGMRRRLGTSFAVGLSLMLAVSVVELVVDFVTYPWE